MAFASDSRTAPAVQAGLLPRRDARGRFVKLASVLSSEQTPERLPEPLLPADLRRDLESLAIMAEIDANVRWANEARRLHHHRQLHQAIDHGFALLDALDLSPLALDVMDDAIAALDAMDGDADLEDGGDDEVTGDDELSLGWREGVKQLDLGQGSDDGEPTLGAPERSPWVMSLSSVHHEPARGRRLSRCFRSGAYAQTVWSQGSRQDGEGEAEAGYDLPEDSLPDEDGFTRPWIDADRVFGLRVDGDCCAPHILDGGAVHVDKEAQPVAGDFVAIFFESWEGGRQHMRGWVKQLAWNLPDGLRWPFYAAPGNELEPVLVVDTLNPPRRYRLDITKVHAVFKVVNVLPPPEAIASPGYRAAARR